MTSNFSARKDDKRTITRVQNCTKVLAFMSIWICPHAAYTQVQTGTVVAVQRMPGGIVVAADSRLTFKGKDPDDNGCKIAAFKKHRLVFAAGGAVAYPGGKLDLVSAWTAIDIARESIQGDSNYWADVWADKMKSRWFNIRLVHPDVFDEASRRGNGELTVGMFAFQRNRALYLVAREIIDKSGFVEIAEPEVETACVQDACAFGTTGALLEYRLNKLPERFKPSTCTSVRCALNRVIHLVDVATTYDKSGTIHGPTDSIKLLKDGSIRWYKKKGKCPENSD